MNRLNIRGRLTSINVQKVVWCADEPGLACERIDAGRHFSGTLPEMLLRHTAMETDAIDADFAQLAQWAPRIIYALIVLGIA